MKIAKQREKTTFVVIRDANSPVWKKDFPAWAPTAAITSCSIFLISATLGFYTMKTHYTGSVKHLTEQVNLEKKQKQDIVGQKDDTIQRLENQYIHLSDQADDVQSKLRDIEKLEQEIQSLSGELPEQKNRSVAILQAGKGGEYEPVAPQVMNNYSQSISQKYTVLQDQMDQLTEQLNAHKDELNAQIERQRETPSIWPIASRLITSGFGVRSDPFNLLPSFHDGLDIAGHIGDPVHAAADGTVEFVGADQSQGKHIIINHGNGIRTIYMHLSKISVTKGETVTKGEFIGEVGSTGRSTGPHLHYGVEKDGKMVNPIDYLPQKG